MSLIGEDGGKCVRMAHLATVGSHAVNGVAALHSELLKASVLQDFYELWPQRFGNVTNGVTPRRFLALANPGLRDLLDETIGDGWLTDLERLRGLEVYVDDRAFRDASPSMLTQHAEMEQDVALHIVADEETESPRCIEPFHSPGDWRHFGLRRVVIRLHRGS